MTITFFSNFLNHHQLPFCKEMYAKLGDGFKFVATNPVPNDRLSMGYYDMNKEYSFVLTTYDNDNNYNDAISLGNESDIVIHGSAPNKFVEKRINDNKITFRYSERIFKRGRWRIISPRALSNLYNNHTKYRKKNLYMLCASAYTAGDFRLVGAYKNKTYKWGYFPDVMEYDLDKLFLEKSNSTIQILWASRFLNWKHPEKAVYVAERLKKDGYKFKLNMIGNGSMFDQINTIIKGKHLDNCIELLGTMSPEKVREHMKKANIFLFTSDYNEGWGAVLNESMNSGCAVVASHAIGSVPFLINCNVNGLVYRNNSKRDLYDKVKKLVNDKGMCERLGREAYLSQKNIWNACNAAENFMALCYTLINGYKTEINDGPCSVAEPIAQEKMYGNIVKKIIL